MSHIYSFQEALINQQDYERMIICREREITFKATNKLQGNFLTLTQFFSFTFHLKYINLERERERERERAIIYKQDNFLLYYQSKTRHKIKNENIFPN